MRTVIYAYLVPFIGLLFLLFLIKTNHLFNKQQSNLFTLATVINLVLIFATSVDYVCSIQNIENVWMIRRITSFINFAGGASIPLLLLMIFRQKKSSLLLYVPLVVNALICFVSVFVKVVFFIGEDNSYGRGPLFFIPLITTFIYLGLMLLKPEDSHRQGRKTERFFMLAIICITIIGTVLEINFHFVCVNYGVSATCLIAFYILKNIHYFMIDPLTGAYNRQMYHQALSRVDKSGSSIIVLLDINDFKFINDTYGHDEGDKALILFVDILHCHLENIAVLYRVGGDEFTILSKKANLKQLQDALHEAELEAKKNKLSFAHGIAEYKVGDDLQEALNIADKAMYENKAIMKASCKSPSLA